MKMGNTAIIGKELDSKKDVVVDLPTLVDTRLLIQANSGGGKSYGIRKVMEETYGKVQHVLLDMEGEFSTLREKYDYLLVGKSGDVPVSIRTAALLAKKVMEINVNVIIDLYELKQHERVLFVKRFLEALIDLPKELWHPCMIIVDEAHKFCPQKEKCEATSSVIDLCTRGRKRGYMAVLATQRLSKLHKDAAAECNNKIIGRTGLDVDMKRAADELGFSSRQDTLELRDLEPGEFFAFGPAICRGVTKIKIGTVKTTHLKVGSKHLAPNIPKTEKIKSLLAKLGDIPKEAEEELRTVDDLKSKVRELKVELSRKPKGEVDGKAVETARVEAYREATRESTAKLKRMEEAIVVTQRAVIRLQQGYVKIGNIVREYGGVKVPEVPKISFDSKPAPRIADRKSTPPVVVRKPVVTPVGVSDGTKLRDGAMKMLKAVAMMNPKPISRQQMATLAGFSARGGTFNTYLSELKRNGWLVEQGDEISITDEGLANAGDVPDLPTDPQRIIDMWASKFRAGAQKILRIVAEKYPEGITKDDLGEESGFTASGGTFNTYTSELRRNNLIKVEGDTIFATKELFLEDM